MLYRLLLSCLLVLSFAANAQLVWKSQSRHAGESMPCGGGDIGLNVWVEKGDLLFYLSRSGTFDENNAMLKLGRVRIRVEGHPFDKGDFRQELHLQDGSVIVSGGGVRFVLWVDVFHPLVHVSMESKTAVRMSAVYETWRYEDHVITDPVECRANSYKVLQDFPLLTYKDAVSFVGDGVVFYHRNRADIEDIFDYTVRMEGMSSVKDQLYNPIRHNTFGGAMVGKGMIAGGNTEGQYADTKYRGWELKTAKPEKSQEIIIGLHVAQTSTLEEWENGLGALVKIPAHTPKPVSVELSADPSAARRRSIQWWKQFRERSYVRCDSLGANYELFRYQLACNAYGEWPTKFNGGLFTFDPCYVDSTKHFSPDFRAWGGGTMTAQNQRLVYYPMLKNGDGDMLKGQFDFYLRMLHNASLRSRVYWNHGGACFTEQIENFGLPNITEYHPKRPAGTDPGVEYNKWLEYEWETVFEFCLMMLDQQRYGGGSIQQYLPFIDSCLSFYEAHYHQFDARGHYIFYPTSAAETYKLTYNSTTVIAAMQTILQRLKQVTANPRWDTMLAHLPPVPLGEYEGHTTILPAEKWERIQNRETPQLYPVFPWGIYGIGKPGLDTAINTYKYDPQAVAQWDYVGWKQYSIFAARLGLTADAARLSVLKFKDGPHRFPAFWGPGFDWTPDHNWGGSAMVGVQEMLLQTDDRKIYLLPAWPANWDVSFKLHAPYETTVEGVVKGGKLISLKVHPAARAKDVIYPNRGGI
ncbi:DUF5703 domain-containing protein [Chitinophaga silvisoli]|uniref:DUF5703 domain-containing protein n=1 Tax=Chitinophaga silvisoli TaxID=2291814 RepID=A0A3E1P8X8_9BACT|nr:DUF5703 domain-containing protein [Chitinophaga silvisoli]RFM36540.1 hypothetical protein DXN04_03300 [Chitinophaga silvisoli]